MAEYGWDVDDSEYVYLADGDFAILKMLDEGLSAIDPYKNVCVDFGCEQEGISVFWRVTSKRVQRELKKMRPLTGKTLEVSRVGEKFDTRYTIKDISNTQQFRG